MFFPNLLDGSVDPASRSSWRGGSALLVTASPVRRVDEDPLPSISGKFERFVAEGEDAHERVVQRLDAGAVELDVVGSPADSELFAASRELAMRSDRLRS